MTIRATYMLVLAVLLVAGPAGVASQLVAIPVTEKTGVTADQLRGRWNGYQSSPALIFSNNVTGQFVQASCINSVFRNDAFRDLSRLLRRVTDKYNNWQSPYALSIDSTNVNESLLVVNIPFADTTNNSNVVRSVIPVPSFMQGKIVSFENGTLTVQRQRGNSTVERCGSVTVLTNSQYGAVVAVIITALELYVDPVSGTLRFQSACDVAAKTHDASCKPVYDGTIPDEPIYYDPTDPNNEEDDYNNYEAEYNYFQTIQANRNNSQPPTSSAGTTGRRLLQVGNSPAVTRPPSFPFAGINATVGPNGAMLLIPAPAPGPQAAGIPSGAHLLRGTPAPAPASRPRPPAASSTSQLPFPQLVVFNSFVQCLAGPCLMLANPTPPSPVPAANTNNAAPQGPARAPAAATPVEVPSTAG